MAKLQQVEHAEAALRQHGFAVCRVRHFDDVARIEVPAEDLPRLTDRLFRVDSSRSRGSGGSGLGLAIAKAIVEGHGGTLTARASALGGLWIEIALPIWEGERGGG